MKIELEPQEKLSYRFAMLGMLLLLMLSVVAFGYFIYRGVTYDEFSPFKIFLLLFLPYGFYSVFTTVKKRVSAMEFSDGKISAKYFFYTRTYSSSDACYLDFQFQSIKVEIRLLNAEKKRLAVMVRGKQYFRDISVIHKAAREAGIKSLK